MILLAVAAHKGQLHKEKKKEAKGEQKSPVSREALVSVPGAFADVVLPSLLKARQHLFQSCKLIQFFSSSFEFDVLLFATKRA